MHMNPGKHSGHLVIGALGIHLADTVGNVLARLLEDMDHIKGRAAAHPHQHHFHRPDTLVLATMIRRPIGQNTVPRARFGLETHLALPADFSFHWHLDFKGAKGTIPSRNHPSPGTLLPDGGQTGPRSVIPCLGKTGKNGQTRSVLTQSH